MKPMKVLIADDELLTRIDIKHLIRWEDYGLTVIGEAENGEQTLAMIREHTPDIVLLDINMPIMNGITVLKEMKQRHLCCKVIILSCHNEFDLVKEALLSDASDYILKNALNAEHLLEALERVQRTILEEQKTQGIMGLYGDNMANASTAVRQHLLTSLINGRSVPQKIENAVSIKPGNLYCIVFEVWDFEKISARYENQDTTFMMESMLSIFDNSLSDMTEHELLSIKAERFVLLISFSKLASIDRIRKSLNDKIGNLISLAKTYVNIDIYAGISLRRDRYNQLSLSYREAEMALSRKFCCNHQQIFDYQDIQKAEIGVSKIPLTDIENELRRMSIQRKYDGIQKVAQLYFDQIRGLPVVSPLRVKEFIKEILNIILLNENREDVVLLKKIDESITLEFIENLFFHQFIAGVMIQNPDYGHLTKQVLRYIENNYTEQITLKTIAELLEISENHISRVFNKSVGMSIPDYINNIRIEKAKELMLTSNHKMYEIAEIVGFHSVVYFNTVFRRTEGCSPNEYKNFKGSIKR